MQIAIEVGGVETIAASLGVFAFEAAEPAAEETTGSGESPADSRFADQSGWLAEMRHSGEFTGKLYDTATFYQPHGLAASRLVLIGGGKRGKFSAVEVRRAAGVLVRSLKAKGVHSAALLLEGASGSKAEEWVRAAVEGAIVGGWDPDKYKSDPKKLDKHIDSFTVVIPGGHTESLQNAAEQGREMGEAQNLARDLANEPANKLFPSDLARAAEITASQVGLDCEVLDEQAMRTLGMGALLGVAQGSDNPPCLIVMRYKPSAQTSPDHLALVGKGVTFDTGGISIKAADGMEKMKYDMSGAAAVIGAMRAIANLKPRIAVTAYIPAVENMINGKAQRPGDIVTSLAGKTIEVLNTDAEGRLILADALTYAKQNGATHIVDAATLTGAIGIALGHFNMGAFTNDEEFLQKFLAASRFAGEKAWQMPMDEEYKEYLKSVYADLPNIGVRPGGSITAAWFLREFADPTPWIHLDIAATAWHDEAKAWISKGPTGVAVRSFVQFALSW